MRSIFSFVALNGQKNRIKSFCVGERTKIRLVKGYGTACKKKIAFLFGFGVGIGMATFCAADDIFNIKLYLSACKRRLEISYFFFRCFCFLYSKSLDFCRIALRNEKSIKVSLPVW